MRVRSFLSVLLLWVCLAPGSAQGQSGPGGDIDLQAFRPAMDSRGYITLNASQVLGHGEPSFGLVTNWGKGLLRFENGDSTYEVQNIISPTLVSLSSIAKPKIRLMNCVRVSSLLTSI